jgi:hypothetical protein
MVLNEDPSYASSLYEWLRAEDELRGLVALTRGKPKPGQMGDLASIITVAIGSGGIASVVINSFGTWLTQRQNRQITVKVTTKSGGSIEISGKDRVEIEALLKDAIDRISDAN